MKLSGLHVNDATFPLSLRCRFILLWHHLFYFLHQVSYVDRTNQNVTTTCADPDNDFTRRNVTSVLVYGDARYPPNSVIRSCWYDPRDLSVRTSLISATCVFECRVIFILSHFFVFVCVCRCRNVVSRIQPLRGGSPSFCACF